AEENTDSNGQIVSRAGFLKVSRGKINYDTLHRESAARVSDSSSYPLPGFLDGSVGQANNGKLG
ncbi:unnamed protein product, partial [marine sediment metagenome]